MRMYFVVIYAVTILASCAISAVNCSESIFKEFTTHGGSMIKDGSKVGFYNCSIDFNH